MAESLSLALITAAKHRDYSPEDLTEIIRQFVPEDDPDRGEELWIVAGELASYRQRLAAGEAAVKEERAADTRANGPVVFGETFITTAPDRTRSITPELTEWIEETEAMLGEPQIANLFRLSADNLRVTALRALARRRYLHQQPADTSEEATADYARMIEDTFAPTTEGERKLKEIPISKAPKWAQTLGHGQRAGSFANKESDTPDE